MSVQQVQRSTTKSLEQLLCEDHPCRMMLLVQSELVGLQKPGLHDVGPVSQGNIEIRLSVSTRQR